jgi:hypothetical protein
MMMMMMMIVMVMMIHHDDVVMMMMIMMIIIGDVVMCISLSALIVRATDQEPSASASSTEQFISFNLTQIDGKEHFIRSSKVDRVVKWINLIALVR